MATVSVWILGDQLLDHHPALEAIEDDDVHIVIVESSRRKRWLPYHRKKLVLLLSAMRHYAERLRDAGYTVDYVQAETMREGLAHHVRQHNPDRLITMAAADYKGRRFQEDMLGDHLGVPVEVVPNTQFLVGRFNPYADPEPDKRYVMEYFYREMRRHFDVLMAGDDPVGGEWNFDKANRKPLPEDVGLPDVPVFEPDDITRQVMQEVAEMETGVGEVDDFGYAVTHDHAQHALDDFLRVRLELFGPYEDAMTERGRLLFHSVLSPYLNIGLLEPLEVVRAAEVAYEDERGPINSVEGFVRQVLGWREFMYWRYWQQMPDLETANHWGAQRSMPRLFWNGDTDMNCIHHTVRGVIDRGYSHHIERLMVISNFCLLAGIKPQEVTEWFKAFYIDAYDWVMQPNVIGMGLNADGGQIATKPYIASANYINKMSDYCKGCRFKHTKRSGDGACPFNVLYWNFLITHEDALRSNPRSGRNVLNLRHLDDDERQEVQAQAQEFLEGLDPYDAS